MDDTDDSRQPQGARDDRRVRGRSALNRDEGDASAPGEQSGVSGSEVGGHQHEGIVALGDTRHVDFEDLGDDPVAYIADVGDALGHPTPQRGEGLLVDDGGLPDRTGGGAPLGEDQSRRLGHQLGVGGQQARGIEDGLGLSRRLRRA